LGRKALLKAKSAQIVTTYGGLKLGEKKKKVGTRKMKSRFVAKSRHREAVERGKLWGGGQGN